MSEPRYFGVKIDVITEALEGVIPKKGSEVVYDAHNDEVVAIVRRSEATTLYANDVAEALNQIQGYGGE